MWVLLVGISGQALVQPMALELLVPSKQFNVRAPAVVLCLVTGSKAVLIQVLLVNLTRCQRKQISRCCGGHIAGLPWNPAACQSPLHSKTIGETWFTVVFSLQRCFRILFFPTEGCWYLLQLLRLAVLVAARVVIVSLRWWDSSY